MAEVKSMSNAKNDLNDKRMAIYRKAYIEKQKEREQELEIIEELKRKKALDESFEPEPKKLGRPPKPKPVKVKPVKERKPKKKRF